MGLFYVPVKLEKDMTSDDYIIAAIKNLELWLDHGGDYLLEDFALSYLNKAITLNKELKNGKKESLPKR